MRNVCGAKPSHERKATNGNIKSYTMKEIPKILPYIREIVNGTDKKFFNTHSIDETLLEKYPDWKNITRQLRIVIIYDTLTGDEFKFKKWSAGTVKKILCRPD